MTPRPTPRRIAAAMLAAGLLALLWRTADGPRAAALLAAAEPLWLAAAIAALTLQTLLSALRWRLTASAFGIALGRRSAVREYYLAQIINQSLPGGVLGDAGRAVRARHQAGLLAAGQSVLCERLAGQIALLAAMALAFLGTLVVPGGFDWPVWLALAVAAGLAGAALLPFALRAGLRLPGRAGRALYALFGVLAKAFAGPGVLSRQVLLSAGTAACNIAAFAFCAWAVGAALSLTAALAVAPLVLGAMLFPLTIGGWGVREGAAAALFPLAGASASAGLASGVAFGLAFLFATLPGLLLLWRQPPAQAVTQ